MVGALHCEGDTAPAGFGKVLTWAAYLPGLKQWMRCMPMRLESNEESAVPHHGWHD